MQVNTYSSAGTAYNQNGYGGMSYYSSETCGYPNGSSGSSVTTGCTTDYDQSEVKYVVDAWALDKFQSSDLKKDATGYSARLITFDELTTSLGYEYLNNGSATFWQKTSSTPDWVYNSNYGYWTMSQFNDSVNSVWIVYNKGALSGQFLTDTNVVRPVVTLKKSAI